MAGERVTRPTRHDTSRRLGGEREPTLTRARQQALRRSEPLTPAQFKELRQLAEQGISPLQRF